MDRRRKLIEQTRNDRFQQSDGYIVLPKLGAGAVPRNGSIAVSLTKTSSGDERFYVALSGPAFGLREDEPAVDAATNFDAKQLLTYVDDCRWVWHREVQAKRPKGGCLGRWFGGLEEPYLERVAQKPDYFEQTRQKLALAGAMLFQNIFLQKTGGMAAVGEHLTQAFQGEPCFLTVYSDSFFIPWPMLYVQPACAPPLGLYGENAACGGFVGYRHVVEHATDARNTPTVIEPRDDAIAFGFTFDETIDRTQSISSVKDQRRYFAKNCKLKPQRERASKDELMRAFVKDRLPDQVSYFYLHGRTSASDGTLTPPAFFIGEDGINANDLKGWLELNGGNAELPDNPLMVFNACQAGQLRSLLYESFAFRLLDLRARGLLGPQIDIPSVFANEYARRFFDRLCVAACSGTVRPPSIEGRVGDIVRALAREFCDKDNNPLGLVYSLYKGAECYVEWSATTS